MNNSEKELIISYLKKIGRLDLISNYLFIRSYEEVTKILEMPEWKEEKYQGLLTSSIWNSNYKNIKKYCTCLNGKNHNMKDY